MNENILQQMLKITKKEKSQSITFFSQMKIHYFNIVRLMIKEIKINVILESFIFAIQLLQLLSFFFHPYVIYYLLNLVF